MAREEGSREEDGGGRAHAQCLLGHVGSRLRSLVTRVEGRHLGGKMNDLVIGLMHGGREGRGRPTGSLQPNWEAGGTGGTGKLREGEGRAQRDQER